MNALLLRPRLRRGAVEAMEGVLVGREFVKVGSERVGIRLTQADRAGLFKLHTWGWGKWEVWGDPYMDTAHEGHPNEEEPDVPNHPRCRFLMASNLARRMSGEV